MRQIRVLQLQQPFGFGELPFQVVHAALELPDFRARGGSGGGAYGRRLRRGHQLQPPGPLARGRRRGTGAPRRVLAANLRRRFARRHRGRLRGVRDTQHGTGVQHVHVLFEGARVRLVDGNHPAVGAGGFHVGAGGAAGDSRQRLAALNHVQRVSARVRARGCRGRGAHRARFRRRRRRRRVGITGDRPFTYAGAGRGCTHRCARHGRAAGGVHGRIEQHGVFAHQVPARPVHFQQQRNKGLGNRLRGFELEHLAAVRRAHRAHLNAREVGGAVEAVAGEGLA